MSYRVIIIAMLLFAVSCVKDPHVEPYVANEGQLFTLSIESFSDEVVGSSRAATSETDIDRGYIIFYNSTNGRYKGYRSVEDLNLKQNKSEITFETGSEFLITDKIIAIFNYDESAEIPSEAEFSTITSDNISSFFPLSAEYLALIEDEMNSKSYNLGIPMYLNDFTDSDRATREVYRSVARMELFIKDDLTIEHDSHTHSIGTTNLTFSIVNAAPTGSVGVGHSSETAAVNNLVDTFPYELTGYKDKATDTNNKIYLYPFPYSTRTIDGNELDAKTLDKRRFSIMLKHGDKNVNTEAAEPRYYKLNLLDKATSTYFDVEPNHNYRVVITAVNSRGYATLEEAYNMPPSNIEYEIYDDKGGLTYSNGQYAISMDEILSFDEVLVYGADETTLEFNNIRYVLPDGGQMSNTNFETNEVIFNLISTSAPDFVTTINDFEDSGKLTNKGQSITINLKGEGECTIALKIKLGNLEIGRDKITIKKVATNGDGDGSFDAHPNHLEIPDQRFIAGSWRSDDLDFGARASSDECDDIGNGGTVIYMGENATPTGYRTMDGYISGQNSVNSYPVFSPKSRKGYYAYKDSDNETRKVMIQLDQLEPSYLGHFGSTVTDETSLYHYNGLICERIEEIERKDSHGVIHATGGVMIWSESLGQFYTGAIWGEYGGRDRYLNLVEGLNITTNMVTNNKVEGSLPLAALYCYMKNDINGDGVIDESKEPINWYLPAQNQMLAMWINMNVFDPKTTRYPLNVAESTKAYYWTCSEYDEQEWRDPSVFTSYVWAINMLEGQSDYRPKEQSWAESHIRCVRGLD